MATFNENFEIGLDLVIDQLVANEKQAEKSLNKVVSVVNDLQRAISKPLKIDVSGLTSIESAVKQSSNKIKSTISADEEAIGADIKNRVIETVQAEVDAKNKRLAQIRMLNQARIDEASKALNNEKSKLSDLTNATKTSVSNMKSSFSELSFSDTFDNAVSSAVHFGREVISIAREIGEAFGVNLNISSLIEEGFEQSQQLNVFREAMEAAGNSSEDAEVAIDSLRETIANTSTPIDRATESVRAFYNGMAEKFPDPTDRLKGATKLYESLTTDLNAYSNHTQQATKTVNDAVAKMVDRGKVTLMQLNRVVIQGGISMELLKNHTKDYADKSMPEFQKAIHDGVFDVDALTETLENLANDDVTKKMADSVKHNLVAQLGYARNQLVQLSQNAGPAFSEFLTRLVGSGAGQFIANLNEKLEKLNVDLANGDLSFFDNLADKVNNVSEKFTGLNVSEFAGQLVRIGSYAKDISFKVFEDLSGTLSSLMPHMNDFRSVGDWIEKHENAIAGWIENAIKLRVVLAGYSKIKPFVDIAKSVITSIAALVKMKVQTDLVKGSFASLERQIQELNATPIRLNTGSMVGEAEAAVAETEAVLAEGEAGMVAGGAAAGEGLISGLASAIGATGAAELGGLFATVLAPEVIIPAAVVAGAATASVALWKAIATPPAESKPANVAGKYMSDFTLAMDKYKINGDKSGIKTYFDDLSTKVKSEIDEDITGVKELKKTLESTGQDTAFLDKIVQSATDAKTRVDTLQKGLDAIAGQKGKLNNDQQLFVNNAQVELTQDAIKYSKDLTAQQKIFAQEVLNGQEVSNKNLQSTDDGLKKMVTSYQIANMDIVKDRKDAAKEIKANPLFNDDPAALSQALKANNQHYDALEKQNKKAAENLEVYRLKALGVSKAIADGSKMTGETSETVKEAIETDVNSLMDATKGTQLYDDAMADLADKGIDAKAAQLLVADATGKSSKQFDKLIDKTQKSSKVMGDAVADVEALGSANEKLVTKLNAVTFDEENGKVRDFGEAVKLMVSTLDDMKPVDLRELVTGLQDLPDEQRRVTTEALMLGDSWDNLTSSQQKQILSQKDSLSLMLSSTDPALAFSRALEACGGDTQALADLIPGLSKNVADLLGTFTPEQMANVAQALKIKPDLQDTDFLTKLSTDSDTVNAFNQMPEWQQKLLLDDSDAMKAIENGTMTVDQYSKNWQDKINDVNTKYNATGATIDDIDAKIALDRTMNVDTTEAEAKLTALLTQIDLVNEKTNPRGRTGRQTMAAGDLARPGTFATGTSFFRGGLATINDAPGNNYRELVTLPNGLQLMSNARNVTLPLPKGTNIQSAYSTNAALASQQIQTTSSQQPMEITLNLGKQNFKAFVQDISAGIATTVRLKNAY